MPRQLYYPPLLDGVVSTKSIWSSQKIQDVVNNLDTSNLIIVPDVAAANALTGLTVGKFVFISGGVNEVPRLILILATNAAGDFNDPATKTYELDKIIHGAISKNRGSGNIDTNCSPNGVWKDLNSNGTFINTVNMTGVTVGQSQRLQYNEITKDNLTRRGMCVFTCSLGGGNNDVFQLGIATDRTGTEVINPTGSEWTGRGINSPVTVPFVKALAVLNLWTIYPKIRRISGGGSADVRLFHMNFAFFSTDWKSNS